MNMVDLVSKIIEFENGEMSDKDTVEFFAELIKTGQCWSARHLCARILHWPRTGYDGDE